MVSSQFSFIWLQSEDPSSQDDKARQLAIFYSNDVKENDLVEEICHFDQLKASSLFNRGNSLNLLNQIYSKGLQPIFPSICISFTQCQYPLQRVKDLLVNLRL